MERGLFIILLKHEIPSCGRGANVKLMQCQNELSKSPKMNYLTLVIFLNLALRCDDHLNRIFSFDLASGYPYRFFSVLKREPMGDHLLQRIFSGFG